MEPAKLKTLTAPTIFDMNPNMSDFRRSRVRKRHPQRLQKQGVIRSLVMGTLTHMRNRVSLKDYRQHNRLEPGKVLVFAATTNQKKALQLVLEAGGADAIFISSAIRKLLNENDLSFCRWRAWLRGLRRLWRLPLDASRHGTRFQRASLAYGIGDYVLGLGCYLEWRRLLQVLKPRAVVTSSDFAVPARALLLAARTERVPSYYIPHALIRQGIYAPPVPVADTVFVANPLERDRLLKRIGQAGVPLPRIRVTPRYCWMPEANAPSRPSRRAIGISLNDLDDLGTVADYCRRLHELYPWAEQAFLRPHPSLRRDLSSLASAAALPIRRHEGTLREYFAEIDLHIAGSTMMHVDALSHGVPTLSIPSPQQHDYYGFAELGIALPADSPLNQEDLPRLFARQREQGESLLAEADVKECGEREMVREILSARWDVPLSARIDALETVSSGLSE